MPLRYLLTATLLVVACLWSMPATAEIFKCVAKNGDLTFSQAPCPEKDSTVTVMRSGGSVSVEPVDCEHARRFALNTAQQMKSGTGSSTIFDNYGGLSALSRGSVSLISYVFQFRTNNDVSAARVSALATAKCQARAFGDVSCEELPASFTNGYGGCNKDEHEVDSNSPATDVADGMQAQATHFQPLGDANGSASARNVNTALQVRNREGSAVEEEQRRQCRDRFESQIDGINKRMRSGYTSSQGESFKKRRRDLEEKMRDC